MENKIKLKYLIIITFFLALAFVGVMVKMISQNNQCLDDPFKYSAIRLKESGGEYACSCQSLTPKLLDFSFDEEGIKIINPENYKTIDYSNLDVIKEEGGN